MRKKIFNAEVAEITENTEKKLRIVNYPFLFLIKSSLLHSPALRALCVKILSFGALGVSG